MARTITFRSKKPYRPSRHDHRYDRRIASRPGRSHHLPWPTVVHGGRHRGVGRTWLAIRATPTARHTLHVRCPSGGSRRVYPTRIYKRPVGSGSGRGCGRRHSLQIAIGPPHSNDTDARWFFTTTGSAERKPSGTRIASGTGT